MEVAVRIPTLRMTRGQKRLGLLRPGRRVGEVYWVML